MANKFTLYDIIAILIPGIFSMWALAQLTHAPELGLFTSTGNLGEASIFLVLGYVVGLLLHGLSEKLTQRVLLKIWGGFPSERWLLADDKCFSADLKIEISKALESRLGIALPTFAKDVPRAHIMRRNREIFYRCYRLAEKASETPSVYNAQYGLFRSLLTTFVALTLISAWPLVAHLIARTVPARLDFEIFAALVLATVISYWRTRKRADDFARSVFDIFLTSTKME